MIGIYIIVNTWNGKGYVGQSVDMTRRLRSHRRKLRIGQHSNPHLQAAWNKYGESAFQFDILCECPETDLDALEEHYMTEFHTLNTDHGYNLELVVQGSKRHSQESKDKIRAAKIGVPKSPEEVARMRTLRLGVIPSPDAIAKGLATVKAQKDAGLWEHKPGKPMSTEARSRLSQRHTGRKMDLDVVAKRSETRRNMHLHPVVSDETREKLRQAMLGKKHTPETLAKMSDALKGRKQSPEAVERMRAAKKGRDTRSDDLKERMRIANTGRVPSDETRAKLSAASRGRKQPPRSPETLAKMRDVSTGKHHTEEAREKIRAAKKAYWAARTLELRGPLQDLFHGVGHEEPRLGGFEGGGSADPQDPVLALGQGV